MRKRLIELLDNVHYYKDGSPHMHIDDREQLADYLIANGAIVLPVKVGDTVWNRAIEPHKVISIEWWSPKVVHLHCEHHTFAVGKRSLGKTVFLTMEAAIEAKKARKEG